jgi:PEP-CTERM motif
LQTTADGAFNLTIESLVFKCRSSAVFEVGRSSANAHLMKLLCIACFALILLSGLRNAVGQSFANLHFENTTITTIHNPGGDTYTATVPGWGVFGFPYGNPTDIWYNTIALDAPAVTLQGTDSPYFPAIQGRYSVLLQGGSTAGGHVYNTNGASMFQTGQIPVTSQSLIYLGGSALQVTFDGQSLSPVALSSTATYTVWGVDISAYAGQSGELRFTAPWLNTSILDGIQFSAQSVPEPSTSGLLGTGAVFIWWWLTRRPNKLIEPPTCFPKVGRIRCRNELGGMLHYYYREAA